MKRFKETHCYEVPLRDKNTSAKFVVTTQFTDDFNIITKNKNTHQELITSTKEKIKFMGLILKPRKCRSLTIEKGKVTKFELHLNPENPVNIASVLDKQLKLLGSEITGKNSSTEIIESIKAKFENKLTNKVVV